MVVTEPQDNFWSPVAAPGGTSGLEPALERDGFAHIVTFPLELGTGGV